MSVWHWKPAPDYTELLKTLKREGKPNFAPPLELLVDQEVIDNLAEQIFFDFPQNGKTQTEKLLDRTMWVFYRLGYSALRVKPVLDLPMQRVNLNDTAVYSRGERGWVNEVSGVITSWADFETFPWPSPQDADYSPVEYMTRHLPEGMALIGKSYGPFELVNKLMGYQTFAECLYDQPDLIKAVFEKLAEIYLPFDRTVAQMDRVIGLWCADDMGFRSGTLVAPKHLRQYVFPIHKQIAEAAHQNGKLFLMHSCGNLAKVMEDLIEDVGIDCKHSFEDQIMPVEDFYAKYSGRISVIGGMDVDLLSRGSEQQIRRRARQILETCAPGGAYMLGSGNSIANYVPVEKYLIMLDEGRRYQQEHGIG